jgi:hypothetical protein
MNYLDAQKDLSSTIMTAAEKVKAYFWRLSGDEGNSLCRFLGMEEEELKVVLRLCKIYNGDNDNFSKKKFEEFLSHCDGCDFTTFRIKGKVIWYMKIGSGSATLPKDMYDADGSLAQYPIDDVHIRTVRTKSQRGALPKLLKIGNRMASEAIGPTKAAANNKQLGKTLSPKWLLFAYVEELVDSAAKSCDGKILPRSARHLHKLIGACVEAAATELLHAALEKYAVDKYEATEPMEKTLCSPEKVTSLGQQPTTVVVSPANPETVIFNADEANNTTRIRNAVVEDVDEEEDSYATTTAADVFLSDLKEEVVLQTLLHKRIHEKKERVFQLEHRNGRRLLVVLPPDTVTVSAFEEEASKTSWVKIMLNTAERVEGMLTQLSKSDPDLYVSVARKRHLSVHPVALNTVQSLALARVGRLNDIRMKKIKSFLRHIGKVNLQLSAKYRTVSMWMFVCSEHETLSLVLIYMNGHSQRERRRSLRNKYNTGTVICRMR